MSRYIGHDAAGWVQSQLTASKKQKPTKRQREAAAEHKGWHGAPDELNPFQKRAFTILGLVGGGIYNCQIAWDAIQWWDRQLIVPWSGNGFGTWDFSHMTMLTFLCHTARIRGYVQASNHRFLKIHLGERTNEGGIARRHPSLDEAVADFHHWYPHDCFVTFPGDRAPAMPQVRAAIGDYYHALDKREHGGVAAAKALDAIQVALGMSWVQGASLKDTQPERTTE